MQDPTTAAPPVPGPILPAPSPAPHAPGPTTPDPYDWIPTEPPYVPTEPPYVPDDPYLPGTDDGPGDPHPGIDQYAADIDAHPDLVW